MSGFVVPPGGLVGFSQMTPASRAALYPGGSRSRSSGARRKKRRKTAKRAKSARRTRRTKRKLKFGSPAWRKKYMKK